MTQTVWKVPGPALSFPQPPTRKPPGHVRPRTFSGHVLNVDLVLVGHVAEDGEDGEPGDEAGDTVDGAGEQGVPGGEEHHGVRRPDSPTQLPEPRTVSGAADSSASPPAAMGTQHPTGSGHAGAGDRLTVSG